MTSLLASDPKKGTYKSPLYYTFKMFSNNCLGNAIDTYVQCDTFGTAQYRGIPYLDVSTTYNKEMGAVFINVVNRHKDNAITADIISASGNFIDKAEANTINTTDLQQAFEYDKSAQYIPVKKEIETKTNQLTWSFPAHSFTQIKVAVSGKK
jgi:alpha-N-arabinofuranosidase